MEQVRVQRGAPVTVRFTPYDSDGEPTTNDPGTVTVGVVRAAGTVLVAPGTATATDGVDRTYALTAAQTATLDELTVTWTVAGVAVDTTPVSIVGRYIAGLTEIRGVEDSTADVSDNPNADLIRARAEVEAMFDRACGFVLSFVPRYALRTVSHDRGDLLALPHYFVRSVRSVSYTQTDGSVTAVDLTAGVDASAGVALNAGCWPRGRLLVGYEHGMTAPPADVKRAALQAIRRQVNLARSGVSSRAMSYQSPNGEIQRFPTPGLGPWITGVPEIDEVLEDYQRRYPHVAVA